MRLTERQKRVLRALIVLVVIALILLVVVRPSWIFGVSNDTLAYSVARHAGGSTPIENKECVDGPGNQWGCTVSDVSGADEATYTVRVDKDGCWDARLTNAPPENTLDAAPSACITLRDYLRLGDTGG